MNCSICAAETRCYQIREIVEHPGMVRYGEGMILRICCECMNKLLAPIIGKESKVETPADVAINKSIRMATESSAVLRQRRMVESKEEKT
jgi:hypothetical protein